MCILAVCTGSSMSFFEKLSGKILSNENLDELDEQDNIDGMMMNSFQTINIVK